MENYNQVINLLKECLGKSGLLLNEANNFFKQSNETELECITKMFDTYSELSSVYNSDELLGLKNYRIPSQIIGFYRNYAPDGVINFDSGVRLWDLKTIREENSEYAPAALLVKYGVVGFASTIGGNVFCMDLNRILEDEPRIILASHSLFCMKELMVLENNVVNFIELSYDFINKKTPEVNKSFLGFLQRVVNSDFEDIEDLM